MKRGIKINSIAALALALFMLLLTACSGDTSNKTDKSSANGSANNNSASETPLEDIHILEENHHTFTLEGVTDAYDNTHPNAHVFNPLAKDEQVNYCLFNLNKQYSTFKGTIVIPEDADYDCKVYVNIYADDNKIYSSDFVERLTKPIDFSVDVKDCEQLKISVGYEKYGKIAVCDAVLIP